MQFAIGMVPSGTIKNIPTTALVQRTEQTLDFFFRVTTPGSALQGVTDLAFRRAIPTFL